MKRNRNVRALCLAVLLGLSVPLTGWAAKPHAEAMQAKTDDPVFVIPKAANPIPQKPSKDCKSVKKTAAGWYLTKHCSSMVSMRPMKKRGPTGSSCRPMPRGKNDGRIRASA